MEKITEWLIDNLLVIIVGVVALAIMPAIGFIWFEFIKYVAGGCTP